MQQDEQPLVIQDEPLKVLGLFPKRTINKIQFDEDKFHKLYNTLCCTICQQLFNNPIYLKCSHRFCKQCLQKYIRSNDKKSCPNCRGDLNTKRDLKPDFGINSLINYAFGNRNKFCQSLGHLQNIESQNIHKIFLNKNLIAAQGLIRTKSFAQQEPKSPKKKVKTIQGEKSLQQEVVEETRGRKKKINKLLEISGKPLQIQDLSRTEQIRYNETYESIRGNEKLPKTDDIISPAKNDYIQIQKQQYVNREYEGIYNEQKIQSTIQVVKKKRGRKKKQVPLFVVQNKSVDLQISQNIGGIASQLNQQGQVDQQSNIAIKQQEQAQRTFSLKRLSSFASKSPLQQSPQKTTLKPYSTTQPIQQSFQKQRKLLNQQFGQDYMLKIMRIPTLDFLIQIKLQRHPQCYFTPIIPCKSIQLAGKCKLHQIYVLLRKFLNVEMKHIQVYINSSEGLELLPHNQSHQKTIIEINQTYWKTAVDIQVFDMKEILSALDQNNLRGENTKNHNQNGQIIQKKKLFQGINVQRQQRALPKKRGRGRIKKSQQKQNILQIEKDQPKRIFYYRLVIQ